MHGHAILWLSGELSHLFVPRNVLLNVALFRVCDRVEAFVV